MEETKAAAVIAEELPAEGRLPEKKKRRITSEEIWGTAFAAIPVLGLLLFSLVTVFPVYYVVSGSVLLTIAVLVRFFGKKE